MGMFHPLKEIARRFRDAIRFNVENAQYRRALRRNDAGMISVIVPMYNEERFVLECLGSVASQSYPRLECIVANDASTDRSRELVESFCRQDSRFRVLNHSANRGLSASRNTGLAEARGKYVNFLDADDYLLPEAFTRRISRLEHARDPAVAGAYCSIASVPEKVRPWFLRLAPFRPTYESVIDFIAAGGECPFTCHAPLLKVEIVRRFGGFDESMREGAEDWELWSRMLRQGYCFLPSGNVGAVYRRKSGSMVRRMPSRHVREAMALIHRAYEPFPASAAMPDAPFVFDRPIAHYREQITRAERSVGYAALAYLGGDREGFEEILGMIDPGAWHYLKRRLDVDCILDRAISRFLCLDEGTYLRRRKRFADMHEEVAAAIWQKLGVQRCSATGSTG